MVLQKIISKIFNAKAIVNIRLKTMNFLHNNYVTRNLVRLLYCSKQSEELELFGLKFSSPVGLASGLDVNGRYSHCMADFGFGFVEIGTLTPKPIGDKHENMWISDEQDIITFSSYANEGVFKVIDNLKKSGKNIIIAANIAPDKSDYEDVMAKDIFRCVTLLYDFVDMFVINLSGRHDDNTAFLHDIETISEMLDGIMDRRMGMDEYRPILLKISPDVKKRQLDDIINYSLKVGIDGIVSCGGSKDLSPHKGHAVHGACLFEKNLEIVNYIYEKSKGKLPVVASGGIMNTKDAVKMMKAGACLIELYDGFIIKGPGLVKKITKGLNHG